MGRPRRFPFDKSPRGNRSGVVIVAISNISRVVGRRTPVDLLLKLACRHTGFLTRPHHSPSHVPMKYIDDFSSSGSISDVKFAEAPFISHNL